jgi:hypothetical protein
MASEDRQAVDVEVERHEGVRSRRHLLKALGAAVAGAVGGAVMAPAKALAHGSFHQDSDNADPAIHGNNTDDGPGIEGTSATGYAVHGVSPKRVRRSR